MTEAKKDAGWMENPAVRNYMFLCLTALVVLFLTLVRRDLGPVSVLPVVLGVLALLFRWRAGPFLLLFLTAGLVFSTDRSGTGARMGAPPVRNFRLDEWVLCGAMLGYFAAHYRLQALTLGVLPLDPRRHVGRDPAPKEPPRDPSLVSPVEIGYLIMGLPLFAFLAQAAWKLLPNWHDPDGKPDSLWRGILAAWVGGMVVFVVGAVLRVAGWRAMTRREARLVLQDALWTETRRDQRRVNRWLAWARRRRKEEP